MKSLWILLAVTAAIAPACSKGGATCEKFIERSLECGGDDEVSKMSDSERSQAKMMMQGMCEGAFSENVGGAEGNSKKMMLEMYAGIRKKATCVAEAKDCAAAKACED